MLVISEGELMVNSSTFTVLQDNASSETLTMERIQTHSFRKTFIEYSKRLETGTQWLNVSLGGAHM